MTAAGFDFDSLREQVADEYNSDPEPNLFPELNVAADQASGGYDQPDTSFIKTPRRPRGASAYERKLQTILNAGIRYTADSPELVSDAAALLMYGPDIAKSWGVLAAHDERVARGIDMLTEGTENPYIAAAMATAPLLFQIIRNHEPILEPANRGFKIPFSKNKQTGQYRRIAPKFKIGIKLGRIRALTHEPRAFYQHVFTAETKETLKSQGVTVAPLPTGPRRAN